MMRLTFRASGRAEPWTSSASSLPCSCRRSPVAVFLTVGLGLHFWLNLLLTLCFFLPGVVHAIWVVMKK